MTPVLLWIVCSIVNVIGVTVAVKRHIGERNWGGIAFLYFWSVTLAPVITFCWVLYVVIIQKENYDLKRKSS